MSFVVKHVTPEKVRYLSDDMENFLSPGDLGLRRVFKTFEEAQAFISCKSGNYFVENIFKPDKPAKFYRLSQGEYKGYDTFDSCIVVAHSVDEARLIHPKASFPGDDWWFSSSWCKKDQIHLLEVEELGIAYDHLQPGTVVMSSFNAG